MAPVAYEMASTEKIGAFLAERRNVVVAGIRRDGRPHLSPNWFYWNGERFYVSTTRRCVKYAIFRRDPRAQLLIDDSTGFRAVLVPATVEIRADIAAELPRFRAIREKHGVAVPGDEEYLRTLTAEGRSCWPSHRINRPRAGPAGAWTDRQTRGGHLGGIPRALPVPAGPQPPLRGGPLVPPRLRGPHSVRCPAPLLPGRGH